MSKKKLLLLLIPIAGFIAFIYYNNSYSEFKPLILKNDSYQLVEVDSLFYQNLKIVLDYNNVKYKVNNSGRLELKRKTNSNRELILNYTAKAMDTNWLNTHKRY